MALKLHSLFFHLLLLTCLQVIQSKNLVAKVYQESNDRDISSSDSDDNSRAVAREGAGDGDRVLDSLEEDELAAKMSSLLTKCWCPLMYEPVCGSDGITYPNRYCFECDPVRPSRYLDRHIVHDGPCEAVEKAIKKLHGFVTSPYTQEKWPFPCVCPNNQALVCDSDGVTHYNVHCMKCYKPRGVISKDGPCDEDDPRSSNYRK